MKNTTWALASAAAAIALSASALPASAQDLSPGTYFSIAGGASFPRNSSVDFRNSTTAPTTGATTTFDTGYMFSGAAGYRWSSLVRTELEANYRKANIDAIAGAPSPGRQQVIGLMGNVLFDVGSIGGFRPYVGGGVGIGWNKWSGVQGAISATFPTGTALFTDRDSAALQWQGIAGLSHSFGERVEGFVEYRYIGLSKNQFASAGGALASHHDDRSHNALVGIRYNF